MSKTKTILRKKSKTDALSESLREFVEDRIFNLVCDELEVRPSDISLFSVCYEPIWTRKNGEKYIKHIRLNLQGEGFSFRCLDLCIVEAYSLEMEDIVEFLEYSNSKKVRFKSN